MHNKYIKIPVGISRKERKILSAFLGQGKQSVTATDVTEQLGCSRSAAHLVLSRLSKKGWLQRLMPGVYGFVSLTSESSQPVPEDPLALAMDLFSPCYISGWTAASHWDLTEQIFNTTLVCSARTFRSKTQEVSTIKYQIHHVSKENIFGIKKIWSNNSPISIADPHRTVIDILSTPELGAGGRHAMQIVRTYWKSDSANPDLLMDYAKKLRKGALFKRLGFSAEQFGSVSNTWIEECRSHLKKGISKFDPSGPNKGPIITRWLLRVNVSPEEAS